MDVGHGRDFGSPADVGVRLLSSLHLADDIGLDITESLRALQADAGAAAGELLGAHDYGEHEALEHWVSGARQRWRTERANCIAQRASELEARHEIASALPYARPRSLCPRESTREEVSDKVYHR